MASKKKREKQRQIEALREEKIAKEKVLDFNSFKPRNRNQECLYNSLLYNPMVVAIGSPGSAKTFIGVEVALKLLFAKSIKRIYLTKSPISMGKTLGFFPGSADDKMKVWLAPILNHFKNRIGTPMLNKLISEEKIILAPMETLKGYDIKRSFVIVEESQDSTLEELTMLATRIGTKSCVYFNGDVKQTNTKVHGHGFELFISMIEKENNETLMKIQDGEDLDKWEEILIPIIQFSDDETERSMLCRKILSILSKNG